MSQIPRYLYGSTNVAELQSQAAAVISPEEAAATAAAPYEAVGDAAGAISQDLLRLQEQKNQVQDANDKILATTATANVSTDLKALRTQADQEQWTQQQFESAAEARIGEYVSGVDEISERNQEKHGFLYGAQAQRLLTETKLEGVDINTDRTKEAFATSYARLGVAGNYQAQLALLEAAESSPGIKFFEPEVLDQMQRNVEGEIAAESLMPGYQKAVENGTVDEYMATLQDKELSDEAWAAFGREQKQYDQTTAEIENNIRIDRDLKYNDFLDTLKPGVDTKTVDAYVNENKWLTRGQINTLRNTLRGAEEDEAFLMGMTVDTTSSKRRGIVSKMVDQNQPPEDILRDSIGVTAQVGTSPDILSNMANNYSDSPAQGALITIGNSMLEYYTNPDTKGVPLPMRDRTRARIELYMDMVRGHVPDADAEVAVNEITADDSNETIQARKERWDDERYGIDPGETPHDYIMEGIKEILTDPETEIGKAFLADIGWWPRAGFGRKQYGDDSVSMSPLLARELERNAKNFWMATESGNVAINAPVNAIRARGAAATDVNYGIVVDSRGAEREYQIQINPITRSANGGKILSQEEVRATIGEAIAGMSFHPQFSAAGYEKVFSMDEIEIGDGVIATEGVNAGNLQWPLKNMGGILTIPDGVYKDQPIYFFWEIPPTVVEEPQINKDAAAIANKIEEQNKPVTEKNDRLEP